MNLSDITIGMQVKKLSTGGLTGLYVKEPTYTVVRINEYGCVEYANPRGKHWECRPDWLVPADTPSGPIEERGQ